MIKKSVLTHGGVFALLALVAGVSIPACSSSPDVHSPSASVDDKTGSIGLDLTTTGGVTLNTVHYVVSGGTPAITPITGDIDVSASGATASLLVRLPGGTGYTVTLSGTGTDGTTTCTGTATFDVTAGITSGVNVPLICGAASTRGNKTINGTFNSCSVITSLIVSPLQLDVGGKISVAVDATDPENNPLSYAWTATAGTFTNSTAKTTQYLCDTKGTQTLTISVNDGQGCTTTLTADVNCTSASICGNNVIEAGEDCDPPVAGVCSAACKNIVAHCGDGIVSPGEQCDVVPANLAVCDAQCKNVVCGDGVVSGSEQCEPKNTATCDATCHNRVATCHDGFVTPPETCDTPVDTATCIACQTNIPDPCTGVSKPQSVVATAASCSGSNCSDLESNCFGGNSLVTGCNAVLACVVSTGCAANSTRDGKDCYCGTATNNACFAAVSTANGPCKAVMDAAVNGAGALAVGGVFFDTDTSIGAAMQLTSCRASSCKTDCSL